jgi:hypothetical protein
MNGHDDELMRNRRNNRSLTEGSVFSLSVTRRDDRGDIPGFGMNASRGVEESVRDRNTLLSALEICSRIFDILVRRSSEREEVVEDSSITSGQQKISNLLYTYTFIHVQKQFFKTHGNSPTTS